MQEASSDSTVSHVPGGGEEEVYTIFISIFEELKLVEHPRPMC